MTATAETIARAALAQSAADERSAFLEKACGGDPALRQEVERLLEELTRRGAEALPTTETRPPATPEADQLAETSEHRVGTAEAADLADVLTLSEKAGSLGRLEHYEIQQFLGYGGMGVVLKAYDTKLHRVVAIKMMAAAWAANSTSRRRFIREARAAAAVRHDRVVAIHAVQDSGPRPYLVMQYIDGNSLQDRIDRQSPLAVKEILRIGQEVAEGLAAAHRQGLVHRDIKPANILLENDTSRVHLTDFGLARAVDDASLTQSGVIVGTPMYMSPEQAAGEAVDARGDLFSLGSVLYAMCTGQPPFRGQGALAVLRKVAEETPRPVHEVNTNLPAWLGGIVARLLAKDPADRFPSAQAVADLLGQHLAHLQDPQHAAMPAPLAPPPRKRRPMTVASRRLLVAAVILLLVSAGYAAVFFKMWFRPSTREPSVIMHSGTKSLGRSSNASGLQELRRLVALAQEKFELTQKLYQAQRIGSFDVYAQEANLLEAQMKLARAERKSLAPWLEQLVRVRREQLAIIKQRFQAGAVAEAEVVAVSTLLAEASARLAEAVTTSPMHSVP